VRELPLHDGDRLLSSTCRHLLPELGFELRRPHDAHLLRPSDFDLLCHRGFWLLQRRSELLRASSLRAIDWLLRRDVDDRLR
jgi:hypothetical protein